MNLYILLPLAAFSANLILGIVILYRDPSSKLNRLYSLFTFAISMWALATFLAFTSPTTGTALYWGKLTVTVSLLIPAFLLHFFLVFTRKEPTSRKIFSIYLYLPALLFIFINFTTNLIRERATASWWGYNFVGGIFYIPVAFYIIGYFIAGLLFCQRFYSKTSSAKEKIQSKLLITAVVIPLVGGTITEAIPSIVGFEMIPLSTAFMTISAAIIAYTMVKYGLMAPVSFSIQRKLAVVMLSVSLITGLIMLIMADTASKANIEEQVKSRLDSITKSRASHVKEFLNRYVEGLSLVSSRTQLRLSLDSYNKDGGMEHKEKMRMILKDAIYSINDFKNIFIMDLEGKVVVSTDENLENRNYSNEEFFVKGIEKNNLFLVFDENDKPVIRLSGPLLLDEKLIGVVVIISKADSLIEMFLDYTGMGETGELYLIDKDGYMITPSRFNGDILLKQKVDTEQANLCLKEHIEGGPPEEMKEITTTYSDYRGVNVLGTQIYIPEMRWCLLAEIDEAEAFALHSNLQNALILIAFVFVIFSLVLSFLVSKSITKPIIKLRDATSEIGKGKLDTKIEIESKDEIGELASAFNQMTKDLKKSRGEIRKHTEELEQKVHERTKELDNKVEELTETKTAVLNMMEDMDEANKRLVKTQRELKESLKALKEMDIRKDQFISIAAHELKTPLTSIHGFSQLLQDRSVVENTERRNKYLSIMDHESKRLAKLVNEILDLSRIDLGTVKLNLEPVDVKELIEGDVKGEMKIAIEKKGLKSEYDIEPGMLKIVTDKERLTEILINLIFNAVKFTTEGKITVKVSREDKDLHFMVKDTGIGIAKENHEKVFERFYQVDSSYTRKVRGAGLGLALCKEFVELLGGKIWIKSEPGKGSEFHFTLPIKGVSAEDIRKEERKAEESLKKAEEVRKRVETLSLK